MNEFDQFVKQSLKVEYYARYTDDFIIVSENMEYLKNIIKPIKVFLETILNLNLHPNKVQILKVTGGIDFLGSILFPHHRLIRKKTRKRMMRKLKDKVKLHKRGLISKENLDQTLQSYLGILSHSSSHQLSIEIQNQFWFWLND